MTTKNKESLIGYDPLAWMNEGQEGNSEVESAAESIEEAGDETEDDEEVTGVEAGTLAQADNSGRDEWGQDSGEKTGTDNNILGNAEETAQGSINLNASLNISGVAELYTQLLQAFQNNDRLDIDASAVSAVDAASLQLLVVLKREAIKENKELVFDFPSDTFIEAAKLLGIDEILGIDQAASGFF